MGRGRKTWRECLNDDVKRLGVSIGTLMCSVQGYVERIQFGVKVKTGYLYSGTVSLTATGGCRLFCSALPVRSA